VAERKNMTLIEMARTMLDEYKTPDRFWVETINTTCHATNRLHLYKLLKKTPYELLAGNKSNVSYFRVFRSKCYVLQKRSKSSKFAPKVYEGFLHGYDSNSRAYRIFNKDSGYVKTTCDTVFDETNGSQVEQYDLDVIDDEEAPCDALQRMAIGDVNHKIQVNLKPQMILLHPHKVMSKIKRMNKKRLKMKTKFMIERKALIKGEMRMMGTMKDQEQGHHTQECTKPFKEITPWIIFLMISRNG
jgi:hypothetical protein